MATKRTAKRSAAPLGVGLVVLSSVFYASYGVWTALMGDLFGKRGTLED